MNFCLGESTMERKEILERLAAGELSPEEADKLLAKDESKGAIYCKVSDKGAISVYGLGRFPVTLYVEQWQRLLDFGDAIRRFAKEHDSELKKKSR
jgi:hypothetical protein